MSCSRELRLLACRLREQRAMLVADRQFRPSKNRAPFCWGAEWLHVLLIGVLAQSCSLVSSTPAPVDESIRPPIISNEKAEPDAAISKKPGPPGSAKVYRGEASWYGPRFDGKKTASGDTFDASKLTAAHRTFPLGSRVRVTHLESGKSVEVQINDRGPFVNGRIIDLSQAAARALGISKEGGTAPVKLELISEGTTEARNNVDKTGGEK